MKQHNRTPLVLFLLLAAGAAVFVLCGIRLEWFVTWETVTPPTCTEDGYTLHHSYFNREKQVKPIEALGHHYLTEITAPTCLSGGYTTYTCSRCGDSYVSDHTEATGHAYIANTVAPTCLEVGYTTYSCAHGDHEYVADEVAPLGHSYTFTVTNPTCESGGYTTYTCTTCDHAYRDHETAPLGHNDQTFVTVPTCTTPGYTLTICQRCNHAVLTDPKEATGHHYTATTLAATCTTPGYTSYLCPDCGDSYTADHVEALGHDYVSTYSTATTLHAGGTTHTCSRCEDSYMTGVFTFSEVFNGRQGDGNGILYEGVDLSHHNGEVDFKALKAAGVSFVILRVGTSRTPDSMFETYYEQARAAGLDVGAYLYTYANSTTQALADAAWMIEKLAGKQFEYPIFFDIEDTSLQTLSAKELTDITLAFCDAMVDAGYYPGVYTNKRWMTDHLEIDRIRSTYDIWLASWIVTGENISDYSDDFGMWQYTATGEIAGISTAVDRNGSYRDYPAYIQKYGYNGFAA